MRFLFYTHSLVSDWNHGNAHFLRGVMRELEALGHETLALEPADGWSRTNLIADRGEAALSRFSRDFPTLRARGYGAEFDHESALEQADVVVVHEWTDPDLIARIGHARRLWGRFTLVFHDTHHRAVSAGGEIGALDLANYDLVLAFGETLSERYRARGWGRRVVTWHEAADTRLFAPRPHIRPQDDLVWIGNWGDGERSAEIGRFLVEPARRLLAEGPFTAHVHGVRYPPEALEALAGAGLAYGGSVANAEVPDIFARHRATVHIPRRPYIEALPGIPTIRVFEALACGIPLVCAPWEDCEGLFRPGQDYLVARSTGEMTAALRAIICDRDLAVALARSGRETILARHTCRHRVEALLDTLARLHGDTGLRPLENAR